MPNTAITGLVAITGASVAGGDLLEVVDVSDTTMAGTGSNKKITYTELINALSTGLNLGTIAGTVANSQMANMAQATVKGRAAGAGTGAPSDLTQTQLTALINAFTSSLSGAAPASGGGTTNFLRADGTWAAPPGGGGGGNVATDTIFDAKGDLPVGTGADTAQKLAIGTANQVLSVDTTTTTGLKWITIPTFTTSDTGLVPVSTAANVTTLNVANLVGLTTTQVLTNKTITIPVLQQTASGGVTIRNQGDTQVNDYSRTNPVEIFGNATMNSIIAFVHNGGAAGTLAATGSGAGIGRTTMRGCDGTNFLSSSASFFATSAEAFTSTNKGTFAGISVTPTGSTQALTETLRCTADAAPNVAVRNGLAVGAGGTMAGPVTGYGIEVKAGAIGYGVGTGGTQTQGTSRTTTVTLNKQSGAITLFTTTAVVGTWFSFTLSNTTIAATDTVIVSVKSGTNTYVAEVSAVAANSCQISCMSIAGTASDAPVINFAVIKGITT